MWHSNPVRAIGLLGLSCLVALIASGGCVAEEYDEDLSEQIPASYYWYAQMALDSEEYVELDLHVNGVADFYFVDSTGLSDFKASRSFAFITDLSAEDVTALHATAQVHFAGTWYLVVDNSYGSSQLTLTGHLSAYMDPDLGPGGEQMANFGMMAAAIAAIVLVVVVIVIYFATRKPKTLAQVGPQPAPWTGSQFASQRLHCEFCGAPTIPGAMSCSSCGRTFPPVR